jgi:peptidoglycan/xylan/chitin deacetylase (PgdA/CDA1 family)
LGGDLDALRRQCRDYALDRFSWEKAIDAWLEQLEAAAATPPRRPAKGAVVRVGRAVDERIPIDVNALRHRAVVGRREVTSSVVRFSGLPAVARRVRAERRAGILLYHTPDPELLERHLAFLVRRHAFVSYETIAAAVATGDWSKVPPKSLAITFDDGHAGNAELVDLLQRFGIQPTIFVCSEIVGTRRRFWWEAEGLTPSVREHLMNVSDSERLEILERTCGWTPTREYENEVHALSLEDIAILRDRVDFQAHTRTHPILPMCGDDKAEKEIVGSKADVERLRGAPCLDFAYPNGRYGQREIELVRRAGFRSARTTKTGWNDPLTDPHQLRIIGMPDRASVNLVAAQSTGIRGLRDLMYLS